MTPKVVRFDVLLEFGNYLASFPWDWFVTLTFRQPVSEATALRCLVKFIHAIRATQGFNPGFIAVSELQHHRNVPHWHLLMLNVATRRRLHFKDWWERYGFARVLPYDRELGARHYVGKYLFKDYGTVITSRNLVKWHLDSDSPSIVKLATVFQLDGQSERSSSSPANTGHRADCTPLAASTVK
jgi:hypothetical protein